MRSRGEEREVKTERKEQEVREGNTNYLIAEGQMVLNGHIGCCNNETCFYIDHMNGTRAAYQTLPVHF